MNLQFHGGSIYDICPSSFVIAPQTTSVAGEDTAVFQIIYPRSQFNQTISTNHRKLKSVVLNVKSVSKMIYRGFQD
jgi:hypothetical protein